MSDNAEDGIMRAQAAAAKAAGTQGNRLQAHQQRSIFYLNERIVVFVFALSFIGLMVIWATASSALLLYGSFAAVILLTILWGVARVRRINQLRLERARQASEWQSDNETG